MIFSCEGLIFLVVAVTVAIVVAVSVVVVAVIVDTVFTVAVVVAFIVVVVAEKKAPFVQFFRLGGLVFDQLNNFAFFWTGGQISDTLIEIHFINFLPVLNY